MIKEYQHLLFKYLYCYLDINDNKLIFNNEYILMYQII